MNLLLLLLNGSLIAGIYTLAKLARDDGLSPFGVLAWQLLVAAPVVTAIAAATARLPPLNRSTLRYAAIAGVLGISAPNLVTFAALAHVPAGVVGVIGALSPLFTYAIALAMRVEAPQRLRATGIALGLLGVMVLLLPRQGADGATALSWAVLALAGPLLLAAGNLFRSLAWPVGLHPLSAASLMLLLQAAVLVPGAALSGHLELPATDGAGGLWTLLAAGALTTVFYLSAFELQKRAGPVVVGQLGYVITVATLLLGMLVFGERHGVSTFAAVATVFAGILLVHRGGRDAR